MRKVHGFTLVEILIVVIILGILAAIVIPQFSTASSDARDKSTASTLQALRGQLDLFKVQHADTPPDITSGWTVMLGKSTIGDLGPTAGDTNGTLGPYFPQIPLNPGNNFSGIGTTVGAGIGWVYTFTTNAYTLSAVNVTGTGVLTY